MLNIDQAKRAVKAMTERAERQEYAAFRSDLQLRTQYYDGIQLPDLEIELRKRFPSDYVRISEYSDPYNITKEVVDARAQVVWRPGIRELLTAKGGEVNATVQELAERLWRDGELDARMKQVNRFSCLWRNCIVWPRFRDHGGRQWIKWDAISPASIWVTQDTENPDELDAAIQVIILLSGRTDTIGAGDATRFGVYTQEDYGVFVGSIEGGYPVLKSVVQEPAPHGYGSIPLVNFPDGIPMGELWMTGGKNLIDANRAINARRTDTAYLFAMQSHGQLVVTGDGPSSEIEIGPGKAINIDTVEGAGAEYIQPGGRLTEAREYIESMLKDHANEHNLSPNRFAAERSALSGIAKTLDELDLIEDVGDQQQVFAPRENALAAKTMAVWNAHSQSGQKFPEGTQQRTSYVPYALPTDPLVEIERTEREIAMAAVPAWQGVKMKQPGISDKEAEEQWRENLASRKEVIDVETPSTAPTFNFGDTLDVEEAEEPIELEPQA